MTQTEKPSRARRRVKVLLRQVGIWLDAWCLRGYAQDTHCWPAKIEKLRSLKRTYKQVR